MCIRDRTDALLPLVVPQSEILLKRYDAVVLEVDSREAVRANDIKIIKGTPASNPTKPTMDSPFQCDGSDVYQCFVCICVYSDNLGTSGICHGTSV